MSVRTVCGEVVSTGLPAGRPCCTAGSSRERPWPNESDSTQILRNAMESLDTGGGHGQQIGATFQKRSKRRPHPRAS